MGIIDLFRTKRKPDLDGAVLAQLEKAGSKLSKPHKIEFFLYFPAQVAAESAASSIRNNGFDVKVSRAGQGESWLCLATRTMTPELVDLQKIRQDFIALAAPLDGEYDGWGTQVVK